MIVTKRGMGCGGRGSVRRETQWQGGRKPVSHRRLADDGAASYGEIVWVLTASGLASSPAEAKPARPGAGQPYSRGDGDKQILIAGASTYNP
jgi:hypothetical protein